jgi:hypothetical protein
MTSTQFSRRVLRVHASAIFVMTGMLMAVSTLGATSGWGIYGFLRENPWGYIGLVQAYWLMAVIGLGLWIGSLQEHPRRWHLLGALCHAVPIAMNLIFYALIASSAIGGASVLGLTFHCVFCLAEVVAGLNLIGRQPQIRALEH